MIYKKYKRFKKGLPISESKLKFITSFFLDKVVKDIMAFSKRRDYVLNCIKTDFESFWNLSGSFDRALLNKTFSVLKIFEKTTLKSSKFSEKISLLFNEI